MKALYILPMIGLLAACGETETPTNEAPAIEVRSDQQNQLFELSDLNRDIAMRRAITGAGFRCQRVDGSGFVGKYKNLDQWAATCEDQREWAVYVGPDETAQVRLCSDVVEQGLPGCEVTKAATGVYLADAPSEN
ncbi:hypothetical protein [Sphingomicrobium lutaoense]|uniref:Uncharacterized protein n=1 Tax=Sphingomicrobium lutaoense TaxID=515949 RepID=A0A839YXT6_9SPHN|nr:hypothetical protein [Sphingomicrobium lutaoense]MBB3765001.1 hypothetical protein [Sphingomicrobium lutaoense]